MRTIRDLYYTKNNNGTYNYYEKENAPRDAKVVLYRQGKTIKIIQKDSSIKIGYLYGEKQWSYDEEEIRQHREEQAKLRTANANRNAMLKEIMDYYKTLSDEELKNFLNKLDK